MHYNNFKLILRSKIILAIILCIVVLFALFLLRSQIYAIYNRKHIEDTTYSQIQPLKSSLTGLGFSNFKSLDTDCGYKTYQRDPGDIGFYLKEDGTYFECSAGIDRYMRIPVNTKGRATFIGHAKDFDKKLRAEGWQPGVNIPWFEKVSQKGNYIANNQISSKRVGKHTCTISFFTAYSDPDPPAISMRMYCGFEFKAE